ncbi:hypothetical protein PT277_05175 [Acetobacteraceae bacterium ESL0709]|nr:hypothetical protein [Acetobacteraceae bacterium ESL0697]MDF7678087.1 hypothetical protein [Acetobacteraceae bacterium ESL0709]
MPDTTREQEYPARYYASYDVKAPQPTSVTGWYDTWSLSSVAQVPPASEMIAMTEEEWNDQTNFRLPCGRGVQDGKIIDYQAPPAPVPLKDQAQSTLAFIQSQAPMIVAMGESFGEQTKAYIKALNAIIDGSDTTITELPAKPEKLTD